MLVSSKKISRDRSAELLTTASRDRETNTRKLFQSSSHRYQMMARIRGNKIHRPTHFWTKTQKSEGNCLESSHQGVKKKISNNQVAVKASGS